jgi:putative transposase
LARTTVNNIHKTNGYDPGPKRGTGTWSEFLERHAKSLRASDFLQVQTTTTKGMVDLLVLFFIHPQSKPAIISGITANPNSAWGTQQARNVTIDIENLGFPTPEVLIIDHDSKSTRSSMNAFAERFAQTLRHECLDHFLIGGPVSSFARRVRGEQREASPASAERVPRA